VQPPHIGSLNANSQMSFYLEGMPQGKSLDLLEAMPIIGRDTKVTGTNDYADTKDSDIIIITAGIARKPGMSRDDLLKTNADIVGKAAVEMLKHSPNAIFVVFTRQNPSRIPLSCRHSSTCGVMFTNPRRAGMLNQSSLR
jgi:malate dehydrogenase